MARLAEKYNSQIRNELKEKFGLKNLFEVDEVVNISQRKASPERQIRGVIEWIAQHGKPDMLIMPVSHYNRFDLPIAKSHDPLHSVHYPMTWHSKDHDREKHYRNMEAHLGRISSIFTI